jgi:hypothetical protein
MTNTPIEVRRLSADDAPRMQAIVEAWVGTDLDNQAAQRLFVTAGASSPGEEFIQFEFDLAVSREKGK